MPEMPPPIPDTYAGSVPPDTRAYIKSMVYYAAEGIIRSFQDELDILNAKIKTLQDDRTTLLQYITEITQKLSDLEASQQVDDKYLLTRQKIIDFMKKAGIK